MPIKLSIMMEGDSVLLKRETARLPARPSLLLGEQFFKRKGVPSTFPDFTTIPLYFFIVCPSHPRCRC